MRVFARVKESRLLLVSDAVALAGMPPGVDHGQVGGTAELLPSGRLTLHGTPYLAGSAQSLLDGVAMAVRGRRRGGRRTGRGPVWGLGGGYRPAVQPRP